MKALKTVIPYLLLLAAIIGCKDEQMGPLVSGGSAPGPVSNLSAESLPGGAKITYTLPDNSDLLYVKAEYVVNGETMTAKSSFTKNSIIVEGFGDTDPHEVKLYAVSRTEKASSPVSITVNPLPPAVDDIFNTLEIGPTFGGLTVKYANPTNANIAVEVLRKEEDGAWKPIDAFYGSVAEGSFAVRGQKAEEQTFAVFIRDRYKNHSDSLITKVTPIFEEQLNKDLWKDYRRTSGDAPELENYSDGWKIENLWDGSTTKGFHTQEKRPQPNTFTIDLGVTTKLSRYKIWQRYQSGKGYEFNHGNPHEWEVWGTTNPDPNDPWANWVLLDHRIMEKPSGAPLGTNEKEDIEVAQAGQEYDFALDAPPVRYLRWKHIDSWSSIKGKTGFLHMMEMTVWGGQPQ